MKGMKQVDLAWLAGLLEGEGSFMMGRNTVNGKVYLYPRIVVSMTDRDVIQRAAHLFETSVYDMPIINGRKPQFRAQVNGGRAAAMMSDLKPFMGQRRAAKIEEILLAYGDIEPTEVRRQRACSESQKRRWAEHGSRSGKLTS